MAKPKDNQPEFEPDDFDDEYDEDDYMFAGMLDDGNFDMSAFWNEPDFLLADIVHTMINIAELEIGVTLFVKGMTLTGILTSERQYLRDLTDTFRNRIQVKNKNEKTTNQERDTDTLNEMFDFTRLSESTISQELDEDGMAIPSGIPTVRFLHLKNPILVGQNGVIDFGQGNVPYIRLRLSLIDGWMLGEVFTPDMFHDDGENNEVLH